MHGLGKVFREDGTLDYEGGYHYGNWKGQGIRYKADGFTIEWEGEFE